MFRRKLAALRYKHADDFNPAVEQEYRRLVVWLESAKIRFLKVEAREPLRGIDAAGWPAAFQDYLEQMSCPHSLKQPKGSAAVLDWLLAQAVGAEYHDQARAYNRARKFVPQAAPVKAAPLDCSSPDFDLAVQALATHLRLHEPGSLESSVLLRVLRERIEQVFPFGINAPPPAAAAAAIPEDDGKQSSVEELLRPYELGFTTEDELLDRAALLLRLLYIRDLRDLQTLINEVITGVQRFTADPRTDTKLGKVGRG